MKKNFTLTFALLLCFFWIGGNAQTQFWSDTFDASPTSGIRTPEENGGVGGPPNTSYFRLTDGSTVSQNVTFTGKQGTNYWAGEDHNAAGTGFTSSGAEGAITNSPLNELSINWTGINISGKTGLSFRGLFAANSTNEPWDNVNACLSGAGTTNTDYITVQYRIDAGAYVDLIRFFNKGSATNGMHKYLFEDTDGNGCGDGTQLTNVFGEFIKTISGTGTTLDIRINVYSEGNNEEWAIDNFRLFETPTCTAPTITGNPPNRTICAGNNTTFPSNATGATGFQWQVNTGSGFTDLTNVAPYSNVTTNTLTVTGATAGMSGYLYRCVAYNATLACFTNTNQATLTVSSISTATGSQTNVSCFGGSNGTATVIPSGGIAPYSYSWSPSGGTGTTASGLAAGSYTVTVTDNIGCTATRNYTITQPPTLNGSTVVTNVACNGGNTGAINLTPFGGTPGYTFNWGGGITTEDRTGLAAGTYSVIITDANGCTRTVSGITVTQPTAVSGTTVVTNIACFGGNTGAINLTPTGGTGPYTFNWGGGITTEDRTGLAAGTYSV
ncbi:SprB repeat-containing protein, partial [Flavobacterium terrigena]